ncbi:hypothetical protein [Chitinophaga varians]|uniref:hypothetical protein n=1 Tax=Chitinophaga varians TaxID=2202339 RepID=UPI00165FD1D8|nr:hypothetical protein [Chitinophaga varians]MBC9913137.1 hypothetical protein [Chitinophaga varians]
MTEKVYQILADRLCVCDDFGIDNKAEAAEEIAQMFCDYVVKIEAYQGHDESWYLGLSVRLMLKQMGFTEQQIINSLEKLKVNDTNTKGKSTGAL